MAVVIDSSIAACWLMPDEFSDLADSALEAVISYGMLVPPHFWYELRNVLLVSERRSRIDANQIKQGLIRIGKIPSNVDGGVVEDDVFRIARKYRLTIYDAAYLEVAGRTHSMLATLDRRLAESSAAEDIDVVRAGI